MITRKILVEQIRRKLAGGNVPNNFAITELEVGKQVDQVANAVIKIACLNEGFDNFLATYEDVKIVKDTLKNIYYCELPAKVIGFKNQEGVYQVSTMQDQSSLFTPCPTNVQWMSGEKINEQLQGRSGYYNQQQKLYFVNYSPSTNTDTILLKLIVDRSYLEEEDDYQITPDLQKLILQETFNFYAPVK